VKKISLKPYPGEVIFCSDKAEFERLYKKISGKPHQIGHDVGGRTVEFGAKGKRPWTFLIFAKRKDTLAHEIGHVLLRLFEYIGSDPREGDGEPFCYMLSHLMTEAGAK
jgi:hypothetical protein